MAAPCREAVAPFGPVAISPRRPGPTSRLRRAARGGRGTGCFRRPCSGRWSLSTRPGAARRPDRAFRRGSGAGLRPGRGHRLSLRSVRGSGLALRAGRGDGFYLPAGRGDGFDLPAGRGHGFYLPAGRREGFGFPCGRARGPGRLPAWGRGLTRTVRGRCLARTAQGRRSGVAGRESAPRAGAGPGCARSGPLRRPAYPEARRRGPVRRPHRPGASRAAGRQPVLQARPACADRTLGGVDPRTRRTGPSRAARSRTPERSGAGGPGRAVRTPERRRAHSPGRGSRRPGLPTAPGRPPTAAPRPGAHPGPPRPGGLWTTRDPTPSWTSSWTWPVRPRRLRHVLRTLPVGRARRLPDGRGGGHRDHGGDHHHRDRFPGERLRDGGRVLGDGVHHGDRDHHHPVPRPAALRHRQRHHRLHPRPPALPG